MSLATGSKLGPYEVVGPLGAGGMGEVYRARDTRLERSVAIKILPEQLSKDPIRKQRLEREAKTVSSLNHPHICTLHDIGQQDGVDYLVLEYLEGETLEKRLEKGSLTAQEALKCAIEIADALDKAHRQGVVHRDIKPGNIMLTKSGAKLMDFGLAKFKSDSVPAADALTEMTADKKLTADGMIVGTFQYMAPEQLEGHEADARTDIFAFGEVLYEMATGRQAFSGKTKASLIAAILSSDPKPVTELAPMSPRALDHVVKTCLAKDPEERWQTVRDLLVELKWIAESGSQVGGTASLATARGAREPLGWLVSCVLGAVLVAGAIWWRNSIPSEQTMYFSAPFPYAARDVTIAPNGHTLAVLAYSESAGKNVIWIYELGSPNARPLADTEGATYPFWSPDGRSLAFFADGKLKKLDVSGGPVQTLCDAPSGRGGTWNQDGVIVFTPDALVGKGLYRLSASGGTPTEISKPDLSRGEQSHRWPQFLPDGKHYLYMNANFGGQENVNAIFVGSLDSDEKRFITAATGNAAYVAPGYLLFPRQRTLLAQRLDLKRFALTGEPAAILTDIQYQPQVRRVVYAVSDKGLLLAQTGREGALSQLTWFERKGNELGVVGKPDVYGNASLAPNGKSVAVDVTDMSTTIPNAAVWTYDLARASAKRLTFNPAFNVAPIWSPDGSRLVFASNRAVSVDLYMKTSDGAQEEKAILQDNQNKIPNAWSPDGKYILYTAFTDMWFATVPELKPSLFLKAPSLVRNGQFSPDGKWVAYASNETGKWEIYVTSFPDAHGRWQVSRGGGEQPRWRGDGKELFYLSADSKMMAAPVSTGAMFDVGSPTMLFQTSPRQPVFTNDHFFYDVTHDGQRFLIITQVKQAETSPMSIILNWPAKLNK